MGDQLTYLRAFPAQMERSGRTLTGRLVPYGEPTYVMDVLPDGKRDIYKEGFRGGAFGPQANTKERGIVAKVSLIHAHEQGLGFLGPFSMLREEADGLYGSAEVLPSKADDVEHLLAKGVNQLSIEFRVPRAEYTEVDSDGTRWRIRAHLDRVALEARGAYSQAEVLAYRAEVDEADQAAREELEHQQALAEAAAAVAAEKAQLEADAEAALARRAEFEKLCGRFDDDVAKQVAYQKQFYGIATSPWQT